MSYYEEQKKANININQIIEQAIQRELKELPLTEMILTLTEKYAISPKSIHKRLELLKTRHNFKIKEDKIIFQ